VSGKREIIKHSSAIQTTGEASLLERKTWNVLLLNAFDDLKKQDSFEITVRDLSRWLRFNSNDHEKLKGAIRSLVTTAVEWNILEKDKTVGWEITTLLAGAKIIDGVCIYSYNPLIKDRLSDPNIYAKLNAFEQTLLKSKYGEILWEYCKDYIGISETPWISMVTLRKIFGIKKGEYSDFRDFNKRIIKSAVQELNKVSSVYIDLKEGVLKKREGRKIVSLKFKIQPNTKNLPRIKKLEDAFRREIEKEAAKHKQILLPLAGVNVQNRELLKVLVEEFELNEAEAADFIKTVDEFRLENNLEFVRFYRDEGKIKTSIRGLTVKAINENIQLDSTQKDKTESDKKSEGKAKRKTALEYITREVQIKRNELFKQKESELSEKELKQFKEAFREYVNQGSCGENFKKNFKTQGEKTRLYKANFHYYLRLKTLSPEIEDFRNFAKSKGFDYDVLKGEFDK
jgi:hypothetical protein